jgi:rare lipoprotein A
MKRLALSMTCVAALLSACGSAPVRETPPRPPVDPASVPDAVPRAEPRSARGNPPFYEVFGQRYAVMPSADGYVERGVASWYGPDFHGGTTSSGERYDMYAMTAAHKTLPLPAYVEVTNLQNGRSIIVRVNDRGPFKNNRIIDLSYVAAAKLDMIREGTAMVQVRSVGPASPVPAPADLAAHGSFFAQAGAFADEANARRLAERLVAAGFTGVGIVEANSGGRNLHRVRIGPLDTVPAFDAVVGKMRSAGFGDAILALD